MDFKDVYKLPLEQWDGMDKVFTANSKMAFDFTYASDDDAINVSDQSKSKIISILNGESDKTISQPLKYEDSYVWILYKDVWRKIILIRGWGYLTGCGGLKLPAKEAAKIQDDFGNWIVKTLQKK